MHHVYEDKTTFFKILHKLNAMSFYVGIIFLSFFIQEDDKYDLMLFDTINPWMLFLGIASTVISKIAQYNICIKIVAFQGDATHLLMG